MKHGNFTGLAKNYSAYRPGYSESVLSALLALLNKNISQCHLVDVGAGTGIWTRMLEKRHPSSITAIEPNDDMFNSGVTDSAETKIVWKKSHAESLDLPSGSVDMLSMASSFHWVDFDKGCQEFHRVLADGGRFVSLWNPRFVECNPILADIENYIYALNPNVKRVSSGNTGLVDTLTDKLYQTKLFNDVIYIEGRHTVPVTMEHYIGAWRSTNDIQVQLGSEKFEQFIDYIRTVLRDHPVVDVTYRTRAWSALKI